MGSRTSSSISNLVKPPYLGSSNGIGGGVWLLSILMSPILVFPEEDVAAIEMSLEKVVVMGKIWRVKVEAEGRRMSMGFPAGTRLGFECAVDPLCLDTLFWA